VGGKRGMRIYSPEMAVLGMACQIIVRDKRDKSPGVTGEVCSLMQRTVWQGCQISPLFYEDGQGEQLINWITLRS
jgi:hypothetical protein